MQLFCASACTFLASWDLKNIDISHTWTKYNLFWWSLSFLTVALVFAHLFLLTLGKGSRLQLIGVLGRCAWPAHVLMISFYFSSFLLFSSFFLLPSRSLYLHRFSVLLLNFFAYCSSPCLFSCSNSPGCPKDYYWACACPPTSCPAHPNASWPHHNAFDQTNTDRGHAKRNSSPHCCNSSPGAWSWFNLHTLRIPLHAGTSYVNPWVSYWT